jgi:hypothetical protein
MDRSAGRLLTILLACLAVSASQAQGLRVTETDQLRLLYFDPSETYLVPRVVQTYHDSLISQKRILDYTPGEKTTVLLTDFSDGGNAGAGVVPANALTVNISPLALTFETTLPAERMYSIMNHEMVHIATMDKPAPVDNRYRKFFGGKVIATPEHPETILYQFLTAPRKSSPRWFTEGIAVFQDTWMAGGLGRSQGAYDEMVFRSMVRDDAHFYDPLGLVAEGVKVDFQVGANAYLYGERFMSFIAYTYSPEKLVAWVARSADSERSYDDEFARIFGTELDDAWQDWIEFEHSWQQRNLEAVREFPVTPYEAVASKSLGSVSRAYYDAERNSLIAGVRYPGVVAHIGELSLETGDVEHLRDIKVPMLYKVSSVAYDDEAEMVFYTADNYAYRDIMALDVNSGKATMLLEDQRIGEIVFNKADRSLWGLRHLNGYVTLVRVPHPYEEWQQVRTFDYGEVVFDLDVSADGKMLSGSFGDVQGNQSLKVFDIESLLEGEFEPVAELEMGLAVPEGFVFSPDGQFLFGSAYYTGVSNIFRFEISNGEFEAVSNTESGFFRPIPIDNDNLIVFHYTGQGFVPVRIKAVPLEDVAPISFFGTEVVRKYPQLRSWQTGLEEGPDPESRIISEQEYVPRQQMRLESIFPTLLGYKDSESLGLKAIVSDPIRLDKLEIGAGYSIDSDLPTDERLNLSIDYRHTVFKNTPLSGTWHMGARLNHADFYDLFGPTKTSRKGQRYFVGYDKTLIYDVPRRLAVSAELNHYRDMDALPRYQNVDVTFDELTSFDVFLTYEHIRNSLGAVDDEKGFRWSVGATANHVDGETVPKILGDFDFGFALPWKHSSIWIRNAAGAASGEPDDEFANFYFGGYGNNYVDRGSVKRYREFYAFPGFELNAVPGKNFYRNMLEWNLPPIRFKRAGTPDFYLSHIRPALFASSLVTNFNDDELRERSKNMGIQLDLQFTVKTRFPMTLSVGYAKAFGEADFEDDEWMVSLKIL